MQHKPGTALIWCDSCDQFQVTQSMFDPACHHDCGRPPRRKEDWAFFVSCKQDGNPKPNLVETGVPYHSAVVTIMGEEMLSTQHTAIKSPREQISRGLWHLRPKGVLFSFASYVPYPLYHTCRTFCIIRVVPAFVSKRQ